MEIMEIRERIESYGVGSVVTSEALSILLGIPLDKLKGTGVRYLLEHYRNRDKFRLTKLQVMRVEILEKVIKECSREKLQLIKITSASAVANIMMTEIGNSKQEHFYVLFLDVKNQIIEKKELFRGTLSSATVSPREVIKEALLNSAQSIILCHNHPSGDPTPSSEDIQITTKIVRAGNLIDITVLDHIIVGSNQYMSFKEGKIL